MVRVWTAVLSVWAMLAIVAILAWTHHPVPVAQQSPAARTLVVQTPNGTRQVVVLQPAAHATTHTSAAPR